MVVDGADGPDGTVLHAVAAPSTTAAATATRARTLRRYGTVATPSAVPA
jgi:hypothetical protein